ncbi:hypothetical protein B0I35DRAFT_354756 [Stachybotrys elegans]|uniref:RING-type E3 ubiquitin transferase n=1 Tax=Stachybotrys elegans TaxID=80388 RepID=A0A8K0WRD2_9HYPO|nr:hypothetical protein B0I35DRAFT_354756 [Stachybotrys elegans]
MRPPRIAILVLFIAASLFVLCRSLTSSLRSVPTQSYPHSTRKSVWGIMYYNAPLSLFPPNAVISLTDDNSTSFVARPAAFGPKLASRGLSGELWVGRGFPDDGLDREAELGCGDLKRWRSDDIRSGLKNSFKTNGWTESNRPKRGGDLVDKDRRDAIAKSNPGSKFAVEDGTDGLDQADSSRDTEDRFLQEVAQIKGKVVLLMRGECGFLEKVMWAQRRGAIAVIVGDNQKGGPLVQMFARGDEVDNVTIPSVFTARTTAHLLSSLTQPGSFLEDSIDEDGNMVFKVQPDLRPNRHAKSSGQNSAPSAPLVERPTSRKRDINRSASPVGRRWLPGWLRGGKSASRSADRRTQKTDSIDWVIVEDWRDESQDTYVDATGTEDESRASSDAFIVGVLDSDLDREGNYAGKSAEDKPSPASKVGIQHKSPSEGDGDDESQPHEGLWVTIAPTNSGSPFFDTILVLVVSPLVTLTVVYSLLIVRARIRRRRWRAPKSVVDRLPVRTYHAVAASLSPSPNPSRSPSPPSSPRVPSPSRATLTTPLLQQVPARPPPRPHTTNEASGSSSSPLPTPRAPSREGRRAEHEKGAGGFSAEWRKYMGRQVECVVCLEEYVDGVSRVMSLPCGHEFHVDCITPWLTTRRRTCPICKGDVVRSLAHGPSSEPRYEPYRDDSDDEQDGEPSSSREYSRDEDPEQGVSSQEPREGRRFHLQQAWLGLFSNSRSSSSRSRPRSPSPDHTADRH